LHDLNGIVLGIACVNKQIYASVGVHPCELEGQDPSVAELLALADEDNIIAIGETGLDYFHVEKDTADWQRDRFRRHIQASNQSGKPLIIHTRKISFKQAVCGKYKTPSPVPP
jgi:TatD DNase family protein